MVPLVLAALFFLSAASCDTQMGIQKQTDPTTGKVTATVDPTGGSVVQGVKQADSFLSLIPGVGGWGHIATTLVLGGIAVYQKLRANKLNGQNVTLQTGLDAANTGLTATGTAIQQATKLLPADQANTLNKVLVDVHTALGVLPEIQHIIQPNLSDAGAHIDGGSTGPLPPTAPKPA